MTEPLSNPKYSLADWLDDLSFLLSSTRKMDIDDLPEALREQFYQKYPDSPYAEENYERLRHAFVYLINHLKDFDIDNIAVVGDKDSLVTDWLLSALYRIYGAIPMFMLPYDFKVDFVIRLAKEQEDYNKNNG